MAERKFQIGNVSLYIVKKGLFLSVYVEDIKLAVKKESVKSIPPNTENWLLKLYDKNYNNDTSNEDKHETNYSMNNDTRNMHIT